MVKLIQIDIRFTFSIHTSTIVSENTVLGHGGIVTLGWPQEQFKHIIGAYAWNMCKVLILSNHLFILIQKKYVITFHWLIFFVPLQKKKLPNQMKVVMIMFIDIPR